MAVALLGRTVPRIRPRKLRLSPVQRELPWMLEEAGAEGIPTIFATLRQVPLPAGEELSGVFVHDTRLLWIAGFIEVCRDYHAPGLHYVPLSADEHKTFFATFHWDAGSHSGGWGDDSVSLNDISVALTEAGRDALTT